MEFKQCKQFGKSNSGTQEKCNFKGNIRIWLLNGEKEESKSLIALKSCTQS